MPFIFVIFAVFNLLSASSLAVYLGAAPRFAPTFRIPKREPSDFVRRFMSFLPKRKPSA